MNRLLICICGAALICGVSVSEVYAVTLNRCDCSMIAVTCGSDRELQKTCGAGAKACAIDCRLILGSDVCSNHRLQSRSYSVPELNRQLDCNIWKLRERVPSDSDLDRNLHRAERQIQELLEEVEACSTLLHELGHICLSRSLSSKRQLACGEWGSFQLEQKVYQAAFEYLCPDGGRTGPGAEPSRFCTELCGRAFHKAFFSEWTNCLCKATDRVDRRTGEWLSPGECCNCHRLCVTGQMTSGQSWMPEYCRSEVLSRESIRSQIEAQRENVCSMMAFSGAHYSCGKLARTGYNAANLCR